MKTVSFQISFFSENSKLVLRVRNNFNRKRLNKKKVGKCQRIKLNSKNFHWKFQDGWDMISHALECCVRS